MESLHPTTKALVAGKHPASHQSTQSQDSNSVQNRLSAYTVEKDDDISSTNKDSDFKDSHSTKKGPSRFVST